MCVSWVQITISSQLNGGLQGCGAIAIRNLIALRRRDHGAGTQATEAGWTSLPTIDDLIFGACEDQLVLQLRWKWWLCDWQKCRVDGSLRSRSNSVEFWNFQTNFVKALENNDFSTEQCIYPKKRLATGNLRDLHYEVLEHPHYLPHMDPSDYHLHFIRVIFQYINKIRIIIGNSDLLMVQGVALKTYLTTESRFWNPNIYVLYQ